MMCRQEGDQGGEARRGLRQATRKRTQSAQQPKEAQGKDEATPQESRDAQDMAAMAKVWAHPEDLHLYQVRMGLDRLGSGS